MHIPLTKAPAGRPLIIEKMVDPELAARLRRMGLFEGSEIVRLDRDILVRPVKVKGPRGEAVLGGGMAMKAVVHLDDGRKLPLIEMRPGEKGHIEGLTGGPELEETLKKLGLSTDEPITFIRILPPMEYTVVIVDGGRVRLTEGMAAKIWGQLQGRPLQLVSARVGVEFHVLDVLGGTKAKQALQARGLEPGKTLILESVGQAQSLHTDVRNPVVVSSREGLRLFLTPKDGNNILVREYERS